VTDYTELAGRYIDAWNETDPTTRAALVKDLFSANARYTDPMAAAEGPEAITATIGAVQNQFPGFRFRLTGRPTATTTRSASPGSSAPAASPLRSSGSTLPSSAPTARSARSSGSSTASRRHESSNSRGVRRIGGPAAPSPEAVPDAILLRHVFASIRAELVRCDRPYGRLWLRPVVSDRGARRLQESQISSVSSPTSSAAIRTRTTGWWS